MSNSNCGESAVVKFQPMPKRFIAWNKYKKNWVTKFLMPSTSDENSDDYTCPLTLGINSKGEKDWLNNDRLIICQSTNLFDTRGVEIFEGSIIRDEDEGYFSVVECRDGEYCGVDPYNNEVIDSLSAMKLCSEVIGHILSSPELLEEK